MDSQGGLITTQSVGGVPWVPRLLGKKGKFLGPNLVGSWGLGKGIIWPFYWGCKGWGLRFIFCPEEGLVYREKDLGLQGISSVLCQFREGFFSCNPSAKGSGGITPVVTRG